MSTTRGGDWRFAAPHSFKNAPFTSLIKTRKNTTNWPVFYTLVRLQYSIMLRLLLQHLSLTSIPAHLKFSLKLLVKTEGMPPHTPSRTPPSRLCPVHEETPPIRQCFTPLCAFKNYVCSDIFRNNIPLFHTDTPGKSCQHLVFEQNICRLTLLQGRPLHVFAQDTKKCFQFTGVLHPSVPSIVQLCKDFVCNTPATRGGTENMPTHTRSRTLPSRLCPGHEEILLIGQLFTPQCAFNIHLC